MNTDYDFTFVSDGELNFLMNSLRGMLEEAGFSVSKCDIDMKQLSAFHFIPTLFIVEAADLIRNSKSRVYLNDFCIQNPSKLVVIGDLNEIADVKKIIAVNTVLQIFERPINNVEVTQKLKELIEKLRESDMKKKILVVDDSPVFLRLISEWLEEDYQVSICPSASAAFHMIEADKPDLILLDYEMPVCNGAQFLQMLKSEKLTADIPVIFLTSKDDGDTVRSLISLKPQGYLLKNRTKEMTLQSIRDFFIREMTK